MVTKEQLQQAYNEGYQQAIHEIRLRLPNKPSKIGKRTNDFHIRAPQIRRRLRRLVNIFKSKKRR